MRGNSFHPSDCCAQCPHFNKFDRACTHSLSQAIMQELADESTSNCPVFPRVRAQSMQDLEQQLTS